MGRENEPAHGDRRAHPTGSCRSRSGRQADGVVPIPQCRSSRYQDRYFLDLTVEQSSLNNPSERASFVNPDIPVFRSFNSSFWGILRDGQSVTTVAAADPVSGESVRIEVSATAAR
jgi:hypothetical protein